LDRHALMLHSAFRIANFGQQDTWSGLTDKCADDKSLTLLAPLL